MFPADDLEEKKYAEVLHADGGWCAHPVLDANTVAVPGVPVTVPEIAAIGESSIGAFGGFTKTGEAYTGTGMTSWHPGKFGNRLWKYSLKWAQLSFAMAEEIDAGTRGNPTLHVGGEQEAVMLAEPGETSDIPQD